MRGEKVQGPRAGAVSLGSSPRAWGKGGRTRFPRRCPRIIPTCVGKRDDNAPNLNPFQDHPHVRGEKDVPPQTLPRHAGSSPRAWGKGAGAHEDSASLRIIPTCVGKSIALWSPPSRTADHPHVRGEKIHARKSRSSQLGSSPRAWGKGFQFPADCRILRIIPTCVGKRRCRRSTLRGAKDHPHVRGEKCGIGRRSAGGVGSSPRAWGKGRAFHVAHCFLRIIPTCVGKRHQNLGIEVEKADHPHVRGEKWIHRDRRH